MLVNNAGAHTAGPMLEQDVESYDTQFDVDVRAAFFLTAALLPKMIARGSGAIVNVSGAAASVAAAVAPAVAAGKAALESFTRSWAAAYGANGIRVNTVAPGPTHSDNAVALFGERLEQLGSATPSGDRGPDGDRRGDRVPRVAASELHHRRESNGGRRLHRDLTKHAARLIIFRKTRARTTPSSIRSRHCQRMSRTSHRAVGLNRNHIQRKHQTRSE